MDEIKYDPKHGDYEKCVCGHSYIAHFNKDAPHNFVGCQHCCCGKYVSENDTNKRQS